MVCRASSKLQEAEGGAGAFRGSCLCASLRLPEPPIAPRVWKVGVGWSVQSARPSENGRGEFQTQSRRVCPEGATFRVNSPGLWGRPLLRP